MACARTGVPRRTPLLPLFLLLPFLPGAGGCARARAERTTTGGGPVPASAPFSAAAAAYRPDRLLLTGEMAAANASSLTVPATPTWMVQLRWLAPDGAVVNRGQKVAEFDSTALSSTLEERRLSVSKAEADLSVFRAEAAVTEADRVLSVESRTAARDKAAVDADVPEELRSRREHEEKKLALARAETDLAKAEEDLAAHRQAVLAQVEEREIALSRARRELKIAEDAIAALTLNAPRDGVVVVGDNPRERRKIQVGDMIWPGVVVARLPDPHGLRVEATLYDVDDGRVREGQLATAWPDAFPDRRLSGRVSEVSVIAQPVTPDSPRRAFRVVVPVAEGSLEGLRPGMSVKVEIPLGEPGRPAAPPLSAGDGLPDPAVLRASAPAKVAREDLVVGVELKGALQALDEQALGPVPVPNVWEYRISMLAPEGSKVRKGQPVLAFDTKKLADERDEKSAEAEAAARKIDKKERDRDLRRKEVDLALAEADSRRRKAELKAVVPPELTGRQELAKARIDLALAEREVELLGAKRASAERSAELELASLVAEERRARSRVAELSAAIASMTIPAPRDGVVVYLTNWRDEKKKVGDSCWRGEKVLEVPNLERLGIRGEVDEADAGRITEGQRVTFRLDAHPDLPLTGRVTEIRRVVQRSSPKLPLKVARLDVALDRVDPERMRPGMRLKGEVEVERVKDAITIPLDALFATAEGPVVFRASESRPLRVTVGRRGGGKVQVLSGLSAGDEVLRGAGEKREGAGEKRS